MLSIPVVNPLNVNVSVMAV